MKKAIFQIILSGFKEAKSAKIKICIATLYRKILTYGKDFCKHYVQKRAFGKGPFTKYVYKRRGVGGQTNRLFVNFYTIENVNGGE